MAESSSQRCQPTSHMPNFDRLMPTREINFRSQEFRSQEFDHKNSITIISLTEAYFRSPNNSDHKNLRLPTGIHRAGPVYTIWYMVYGIQYIVYTLLISIQYYTILYYTILYYTILYCTVLGRPNRARVYLKSPKNPKASPKLS